MDFSNVKTEVALEIISFYIGIKLNSDAEEVEKLKKERESIYQGNTAIVDKVIKVYGKEIKEYLKMRK